MAILLDVLLERTVSERKPAHVLVNSRFRTRNPTTFRQAQCGRHGIHSLASPRM